MTKQTLYNTIKENTYTNDKNKINETIELFNSILAQCRLNGITTIKASYNGGGDEGFINELFYYKGKNQVDDFEPDGNLEDILYDLLPGGWENNLGGHGEITIDLKNNKIKVDHNTCVEHYENEEFNIDL